VLVVASLLMLIPTMIAGKILSQFLLRPIQELISAMKENIKTRNWKKIALKNRSRDELYEMEETFNQMIDRKSTRLNSSHVSISYAVFCLKKKKKKRYTLVVRRMIGY